MNLGPKRVRLFATTILGGVALTFAASPASAQSALDQSAASAKAAQPDCKANPTLPDCPPAPVGEIVVTGSRITRIDTSSVQPITAITAQDIHERGFTNLADIINQLPNAGEGITPIGGQNSFGVGRNYIDLFSLGSNRTLTLVNGMRFVGDNPSNIFANEGGNQVDINALPTLFVDKVDTVPATGAAVYGSDAISGVVNIIMKKRFDGAEVTAQTGISTYGDAPRYTVEAAVGHSFFDDKLNVGVDFQYDHTNALSAADRPYTAMQFSWVPNPAYAGPSSGVPAQIVVPNGRWAGTTTGGLPFQLDAQTPIYLPGTTTLAQFGKNGNLIPYNTGVLYPSIAQGGLLGGTSSGGDALNFEPISPLQTQVDRKVLEAIGSYQITPHMTLYANLFYSDNEAIMAANQPNYADVINGVATGYANPATGQALLISSQNAFLTPQAKSVLAANGVSDFILSRANTDITPDPITAPVTTVNASFNLVGDFNALNRDFNWNAAYVRGSSYSQFHTDNLVYGNAAAGVPDLFGYALDSVLGPNGQPVCRVTLEYPNSTNAAIKNCLPFNPFGVSNNSNAVLRYITADQGNKALNEQDDFQANLGATVITLPAGDAKLTGGFEYRHEMASFSPSLAAAEGIGNFPAVQHQAGHYDTKEVYVEGLLPILGPNFNFPLAERFQLEGAYRYVDNSIAGDNKSWSFGGEFSPIKDLTFRGSRSNTFRGPSLEELFSASTGAYDQAADPCQVSNLSAGPNPAARQANCAKAFAALGANLSNFTLSNVGDFEIPVTSGGNPRLKNEIGNSWTYGLVAQPRFAPGLTLTADYIEINITKAIEFYGVGAAMESCYDAPVYPSAACSLFTRQGGTGQIIGANETYVNAGFQNFAAMTYAVNYERNVNQLPFVDTTHDLGRLAYTINITNVRHSVNSVSGLGYDDINTAGTIGTPRWRWTSTLTWQYGPARVAVTTHYFGPSYFDLTYTAANQLPLKLSDNVTNDLSLAYKITPKISAHLNINNITNQAPPYPVGAYSYGYYDFIGRYFLFGVDAKF